MGCGGSSSASGQGAGSANTPDAVSEADTSTPELPKSQWEETFNPTADLGDLKKKFTEATWFDFLVGVMQLRFPAGHTLAQTDGAIEYALPYVENNKDRFDRLMERNYMTITAMCERFKSNAGEGEPIWVVAPRPASPQLLDTEGVTTPPRSSVASLAPPSIQNSPARELLMTGAGGQRNFFAMISELDCDTHGLLAAVAGGDMVGENIAPIEVELVMGELVYIALYLRAMQEGIKATGDGVRTVAGVEKALRESVDRALWAIEQAKSSPIPFYISPPMQQALADTDVLGELDTFFASP
jgi:hypothetical protein